MRDARSRVAPGNGLAGDRRIFLVLLEGENRSHSDVQTLANVSNAGSYAAGAAAARLAVGRAIAKSRSHAPEPA